MRGSSPCLSNWLCNDEASLIPPDFVTPIDETAGFSPRRRRVRHRQRRIFDDEASTLRRFVEGSVASSRSGALDHTVSATATVVDQKNSKTT
jgi:hypothetical protein